MFCCWGRLGCHLSDSNSSEDKHNSSMLLFSPFEKVSKSKYGRALTFLHELSHWSYMWAMRGPCQLIRRGWWRLHPSPYGFFHSETSPVGTFPSSVKPENISNCKDHQWAKSWNEIFRATHWHELDLPGKVMLCYHGNREHHRYVKKVARRGAGGA